jgi:hypothetical protein
MAMQEEHIMDIALNGENYCLAIHRRQRYFVAGALIRTRGARMFTPQIIAGLTRKEGMYHFFEMKGTALSLGSQCGFEVEMEEGRSEHLQSINNRRTSHFHHPDIWHPINEAFTICTETLFSRCWGG